MALCLEDFNPAVKEAAAWGIGYISRHNKCLAQAAIDAGIQNLNFENILILQN